jgi:GcrA cell cycle regulator
MQSMEWPPEHCDALREFLVGGLSYAATAKAINAKFDTGYSRSATIGRARRMGLAGSNRPQVLLRPRSNSNAPVRPKLHRKPFYKPWPDMPAFKRVEVKLRCVAVEPRHLSLFELGRGDCRYPYGGDAESEAITFCGHRQRPGSSYCAPHFRLTRRIGTPGERAAAAVALRLVRRERRNEWWRKTELRHSDSLGGLMPLGETT